MPCNHLAHPGVQGFAGGLHRSRTHCSSDFGRLHSLSV
jgi:hypothetical protein